MPHKRLTSHMACKNVQKVDLLLKTVCHWQLSTPEIFMLPPDFGDVFSVTIKQIEQPD